MNNKIRISWILSLSLTAINVAFILFFLFHSNHHSHTSKSNEHKKHRCIMHQELNLNQTQKNQYDSIKSAYQSKAQQYVDSLRLYREILMSELNKDTSNQDSLNLSIELIHKFNRIIFGQLIDQYLDIKQILNIHQQEKLSAIYCDIFGCSHIKNCKSGNDCRDIKNPCCSKKE